MQTYFYNGCNYILFCISMQLKIFEIKLLFFLNVHYVLQIIKFLIKIEFEYSDDVFEYSVPSLVYIKEHLHMASNDCILTECLGKRASGSVSGEAFQIGRGTIFRLLRVCRLQYNYMCDNFMLPL